MHAHADSFVQIQQVNVLTVPIIEHVKCSQSRTVIWGHSSAPAKMGQAKRKSTTFSRNVIIMHIAKSLLSIRYRSPSWVTYDIQYWHTVHRLIQIIELMYY